MGRLSTFRNMLWYSRDIECPLPLSTRLAHNAIGTVIGKNVKLGKNVAIHQNVTIGSRGYKTKQPTLKDDVVVYPGSVIV